MDTPGSNGTLIFRTSRASRTLTGRGRLFTVIVVVVFVESFDGSPISSPVGPRKQDGGRWKESEGVGRWVGSERVG